MKKILGVLGIALLIGVFAYPAFSRGPGWGWGHHMMGFWDRDYQYGSMHERGYEGLSDRNRSRMEELDRKYYEETEGLRNQILEKSEELDALLDTPNPEQERVMALQGEISDLRAGLDRKELDYELEARKILPDDRFERGYGRGSGRDHWGRGASMGYGPGTCWR
jgi:zinc resistance-associated protein